MRTFYTSWYPESEGVQNAEHWYANAILQRFQEYAPNFADGQQEAELLDLGNYEGPEIAMFVAENDAICTYTQAEETKSIIGDDVTFF